MKINFNQIVFAITALALLTPGDLRADDNSCAVVCTQVEICDERGDLLVEFLEFQKEFDFPTDYCWKEAKSLCNERRIAYLEDLNEKTFKTSTRRLRVIKRLRRQGR